MDGTHKWHAAVLAADGCHLDHHGMTIPSRGDHWSHHGPTMAISIAISKIRFHHVPSTWPPSRSQIKGKSLWIRQVGDLCHINWQRFDPLSGPVSLSPNRGIYAPPCDCGQVLRSLVDTVDGHCLVPVFQAGGGPFWYILITNFNGQLWLRYW